jgi:hypothetical protein
MMGSLMSILFSNLFRRGVSNILADFASVLYAMDGRILPSLRIRSKECGLHHGISHGGRLKAGMAAKQKNRRRQRFLAGSSIFSKR